MLHSCTVHTMRNQSEKREGRRTGGEEEGGRGDEREETRREGKPTRTLLEVGENRAHLVGRLGQAGAYLHASTTANGKEGREGIEAEEEEEKKKKKEEEEEEEGEGGVSATDQAGCVPPVVPWPLYPPFSQGSCVRVCVRRTWYASARSARIFARVFSAATRSRSRQRRTGLSPAVSPSNLLPVPVASTCPTASVAAAPPDFAVASGSMSSDQSRIVSSRRRIQAGRSRACGGGDGVGVGCSGPRASSGGMRERGASPAPSSKAVASVGGRSSSLS